MAGVGGDFEGMIFGYDGKRILTIWESIQSSLPPVEHLEVKRMLGFERVERNEALAEEARVLVSLLESEEGAIVDKGDPRASFERTTLQSQISFFLSSLAGAAEAAADGAAGRPTAAAAAAAVVTAAAPRKPVPASIAGGSTGSGSSAGARQGSGAHELVQGVLFAHEGGQPSSSENVQPAVQAAAAAVHLGAKPASWTAVAQASSLQCLRAALEAEEEALTADIAYLQGRVMETASEARQDLDTAALRARKAELQRRWLEVEQQAAQASGSSTSTSSSSSAPASAVAVSRLHKALRLPSGRVPPSAGEGSAAVEAVGVAGGGSGKGPVASRGASAALAARAAGRCEAEVADSAFF